MLTSDTLAGPGAVRQSAEQHLAGTTLGGRYEVLQLLGVGGMGAVYRAHDRELDEVVALKVIRSDHAHRHGMVEQFRHEVKLARRVTHVNVARTFELGVIDDLVFCTMELVEGESLRDKLTREGALTFAQAAEIASAVCHGLAVAHAAGVIHRDIKPENILLAPRGRVVLADFGVAAIASADSDGSLVGTLEYMAPEQARGEPPTPATDVYAVGVVLFEMVTGLHAFTGTFEELIVAKQDVERLDLEFAEAVMREPATPELKELVGKATTRDPAHRIASASELARRLEPWLAVQRIATSPGIEEPAADHAASELDKVIVLAPRAVGEAKAMHVAEGVHQELLRRLARRPRLRVWPRVDAPDDEPSATFVELRASHVLAVTIRRADRESTLQLPLDIASVALAADAITVATLEMMARADDPTANERLDILLRARLMAHQGFEHVQPAYDLLSEGLARFPSDPKLACELAALVLRYAFIGDNPSHDVGQVRRLVESALAAAPNLAEAHVAAAHLEQQTGDAVLAAREFRTAIACSPYLAEPHEGIGRMLLEAGFLDDAMARLEDALAIAPNLSSVRWEIARAHALEHNWFAHEQLLAVLKKEGDRPLARFRFALWRGDRAEMVESRAAWARFVGRFEPALVDLVFSSVLDGAYAAHRDELVSLVMTSRSHSKRRIAFLAQVVAEAAGHVGDVETCLAMLTHAVDHDLFDFHWFLRCPTIASARSTQAGTVLQAIVQHRANAILDALYGDRASAEDTIQFP